MDGNVADVGGGIQAISGPTLSLFNVTVSHNRATTSGGGISSGSSALSLTNVTISGNTVNSAFGGGLDLAAAVSVATLSNVTVAGNTSVGGAAGIEGVTGSGVVLRNSIVANNPPTPGGSGNCGGTGTFTSQGFNLVFPGSGCGLTQMTDRQNQDPKLGPLVNNGGSTPTMALLAGSAAIDAGNTATPGTGGTSCTGVDQRGIVRLQDGDLDGTARCDMGSFEARIVDLCVQRPPVRLAATPNGQGGLNVTVTRGLGTLTELDFHNSGTSHVADTNARIDIAGSSSFGTEFHFHRSTPQVSEQFTVAPLDATRPTTVPLDVFDACGRWSTLVGGGAGAIGRAGMPTVAGLEPGATAGRTLSPEVRAIEQTPAIQGVAPAGPPSVADVSAAQTTTAPATEVFTTAAPVTATRTEERPAKPTEREHQRRTHTSARNPEDTRVEGNVVAVDLDARPPTITIADRDGLVTLRLHGDAASVSVTVGDYVSAEGEKVTEELYEIDDLSVE